MKSFLHNLIKYNFECPKHTNITHAIGYGSAVMKQANYDITESDQVIDLMLIVNDAKEFHL